MKLVASADADKFGNQPHGKAVMGIPGQCGVHRAVNMDRHGDRGSDGWSLGQRFF